MRTIINGSIAGATRIDGQELRERVPSEVPERKQSERPDRNVRRINGQRISFRDLAQMAFPIKTEANLAFLARVEARTARRWLADDNEPPAEVLGVVLCEIMRRFHQRD
jgi:hypothetical protein